MNPTERRDAVIALESPMRDYFISYRAYLIRANELAGTASFVAGYDPVSARIDIQRIASNEGDIDEARARLTRSGYTSEHIQELVNLYTDSQQDRRDLLRAFRPLNVGDEARLRDAVRRVTEAANSAFIGASPAVAWDRFQSAALNAVDHLDGAFNEASGTYRNYLADQLPSHQRAFTDAYSARIQPNGRALVEARPIAPVEISDAEKEEQTHTIRPGDSLSSLIRLYYPEANIPDNAFGHLMLKLAIEQANPDSAGNLFYELESGGIGISPNSGEINMPSAEAVRAAFNTGGLTYAAATAEIRDLYNLEASVPLMSQSRLEGITFKS